MEIYMLVRPKICQGDANKGSMEVHPEPFTDFVKAITLAKEEVWHVLSIGEKSCYCLGIPSVVTAEHFVISCDECNMINCQGHKPL